MPNLTHFYYLDLAYWDLDEDLDDTKDEADEEEHERRGRMALRAMALAAPRLKFVAIKYDDSSENIPEWVTIQRDNEGRYLGTKETPYHGHVDDIDIKKWGGCYYGVDRGPRRPMY